MQTDFSHHCHLQHQKAEGVSSTVWGIMQRIQDEKTSALQITSQNPKYLET